MSTCLPNNPSVKNYKMKKITVPGRCCSVPRMGRGDLKYQHQTPLEVVPRRNKRKNEYQYIPQSAVLGAYYIYSEYRESFALSAEIIEVLAA